MNGPSTPRSFPDLVAGQCQYPLGKTSEPSTDWCAAPVKPGKPYCEAHCKIAYLPASKPGSPFVIERKNPLSKEEK